MPVSEFQARYNTKVKIYPNGYTNTTYCNHDIFRDPDFEKSDNLTASNIPRPVELPALDPTTELYAEHYKEQQEKKRQERQEANKSNAADPRADSLKRAKEKIFDIVLLNDFKYFITGTFAENESFDRSEASEVIKPLLRWLKDRTYRNGLQYVLTAERHKKGGIHIHALVNDVLPLTYSGRRLYQGKAWKEQDILKERDSFEPFKKIYNIDNWKFGYSTAIPCDNNKLKLARYVTKYITKEQTKIFGKFYWSSKNIEREPKVILTRTRFGEIPEEEKTPPGTSYRFKYDSFFSDMDIDFDKDDDEIIDFLEEKQRIQCLER